MPEQQVTLPHNGQLSPITAKAEKRLQRWHLVGWKLTRQRGLRDGIEHERRSIVAYLRRRQVGVHPGSEFSATEADMYRHLAVVIEKGAHHV